MFNLEKLFHLKVSKCDHKDPYSMVIADAVDREGGFIRVFYCKTCRTYTYKEIDHEEGDPAFFSKIREQQYRVIGIM